MVSPIWIDFSDKTSATKTCKAYKPTVEKQFDKKIKIVRFDHGD